MNKFKIKIITPDGIKFNDEISFLSLPTSEGEIGILPQHTSLITIVKPGEITLYSDKKEEHLATEGGIVEINNNYVKLLIDTAEEADNLDELKILEAKKQAEERLKKSKDETEFTEASSAIEKQLVKLSFLKKRKHKYR